MRKLTIIIALIILSFTVKAQVTYCTPIPTQPRINIVSVSPTSITVAINAAVPLMDVCKIQMSETADFQVSRTTILVPTPSGTTFPLNVVVKANIVPGQIEYFHAQALNTAYSASTFGQPSMAPANNTPQASQLGTPVLTFVSSSSSGITVSWPHVANAVGYWVQRGSGGNFQAYLQSFPVTDTGSGTQTYADNGTGNPSLRVYAVAPGLYTDSAYSNTITHTTP